MISDKKIFKKSAAIYPAIDFDFCFLMLSLKKNSVGVVNERTKHFSLENVVKNNKILGKFS